MELASKYDPQAVESKWYEYWLNNKLFSSKPDGREPYTIVIPPPNVTGVLHMGHMLNNTIQDILVRRARMEGKNACWVPGTDHASIATEAKVVGKLAEKGIKKTDLSREEFLEHAWDWTHEHGGIILKQLRKLGCSCDWDRTAFTMDETRSKGVIKVFCDLYEKGLIYRGVRMVNWDPKAQTALSDEEVIYKDEHSKLYYLKYRVVETDCKQVEEGNVMHKDDKGYYAVVATTRPETIMGDTAMCINPADVKNTWLKGKHVIVPLVGREIPVIEDGYVDIQFGTGCLKVTPAHDINDHALGLKHELETIDIFNDNGTISKAAGLYVGQDRMDVRKQIAKDLEAAGLMEKIEDYDNKVGFSERTNVPIEPKLSTQWFLKMQHFADLALGPVMSDEIEFYPKKYKNTYRHWLENIKDWCISRQRDWGVPIAFFRDKTTKEPIFDEEILAKTAQIFEEKGADAWWDLQISEFLPDGCKYDASNLEKVSDILDVWFDSGSTWHAVLQSGEYDAGKYPTNMYLEGSDQHRGWFQSSLLLSCAVNEKAPYSAVLTHGFTFDEKGQKMSKSVGNVVAPTQVAKEYGIEILRLWVAMSDYSSDLKISNNILKQISEQYRKIRNTIRFLLANVSDLKELETSNFTALDKWILSKASKCFKECEIAFRNYDFSKGFSLLMNFLSADLSSIYLDVCKDRLYCDELDAPRRKSAQTAMVMITRTLLPLIAPVLTYTIDEVMEYAPQIIKDGAKDAFDLVYKELDFETFESQNEHEMAIKSREKFFEIIDTLKKDKIIKSTLELCLQTDSNNILARNLDEISDWYMVSEISTINDETPIAGFEVLNENFRLVKAKKHKCPRCWKFTSTDEDALCPRCNKVINNAK